jgi:hypothetical protein
VPSQSASEIWLINETVILARRQSLIASGLPTIQKLNLGNSEFDPS